MTQASRIESPNEDDTLDDGYDEWTPVRAAGLPPEDTATWRMSGLHRASPHDDIVVDVVASRSRR